MINNYNPTPEFPVLARDLHAELGVRTGYATWFKRHGSSKFLEWLDYTVIESDLSTTGRPRTDHLLTTGMATAITRMTPKPVEVSQQVKAKAHAHAAESSVTGSELVKITVGEPRVSTLDIAKYSENTHAKVLQLVGTHAESLTTFGQLDFESRAGYNNAVVRHAMLNEPQATLLITFMRNTKKVIEFKRELVKQFYEMKEILWTLKGPAPAEPKSLTERTLELIKDLSSEIEKQEVIIDDMAPLAAQASTFNAAHGNVGKQEFARSVVSWSAETKHSINAIQVYAFLNEVLGIFVAKGRKDAGQATLTAVRSGYAVTRSGTNNITGHAWTQGMLTPKGVEYVWKRIHKHLNQGKSLDQH